MTRSSADIVTLPFQKRVVNWLMACFSMEVCRDGIERNHRFLEEALELVQSLECTRSEAHQLVDYVFDRPVGEPMQELGGALVTLTALANCHDMDLMEAGESELARVWTKIEKIRAKQLAKPKHSPLPERATPVEAARAQEPVAWRWKYKGDTTWTVGRLPPPGDEQVLEPLFTGVAQPSWRSDLENAPTEPYQFFLVRPKGTHPSRGGAFLPTTVQRIDGKFYTSDNELDPIYFGQDEPDGSPFKTTLEWQPLPADWYSVSSTHYEPPKVIGRVTGKEYDGDQVPGMPGAICHACGLKDYPCVNPDCPNTTPISCPDWARK